MDEKKDAINNLKFMQNYFLKDFKVAFKQFFDKKKIKNIFSSTMDFFSNFLSKSKVPLMIKAAADVETIRREYDKDDFSFLSSLKNSFNQYSDSSEEDYLQAELSELEKQLSVSYSKIEKVKLQMAQVRH